MGKLINGILGAVSGKIGNMETYVRNGVTYVRAAKKKKKRKSSEKQLASRMGMRVVNNMINSMTAYVGVGFGLFAQGKTFSANNAAKSYQLLRALRGDYPEINIDYSKVLLSRGGFQPALNPSIEVLDEGLKYHWQIDPLSSAYESNGQAMLMVYCSDLLKSFYKIGGASRFSGWDKLDLPETFKGKMLECYISFVADDRRAISDSTYLGSWSY